MPIYEYRCVACGRKASLFFRSIAAAESEPACPNCGERQLRRMMSRVWSRRLTTEDTYYPQPTFEDEGVPFYGPDPLSDPYCYDNYGMPAGDDESAEDVAAMAREARAMAQMMGEPLDAEFDAALRHVERGADPDEVFGELDAKESDQEPSEAPNEP